MDGLSSEVRQRTTELEQLKLEVEQARAELLELGVERTTAEAGMAKFKREKAQLDDIQHSLNSKIHELKRCEPCLRSFILRVILNFPEVPAL